MKKIAIICITSLFLASSGYTSESEGRPIPVYYSLLHLILSPDDFVGFHVSVAGFLRETGDWLYLTKEHADVMDTSTAVPVHIDYTDEDLAAGGIQSTGCEYRFVRLFGLVRKDQSGEVSIADVYRIKTFEGTDDFDRRTTCWANPDSSLYEK